MIKILRRRDEEGSLVLVLAIMMVVAMLTVTVVASTDAGMLRSRRSGNSANALQLADAGVNDAIRSVPHLTVSQSPYTSTPVSLPGSGSYSWTATIDATSLVWHVDSTGTDTGGQQRHIRVDAAPQAIASNAYFIQSSISIPPGSSLDSYTDGSSAQSMCTGHGTFGTDNAANLTFSSGTKTGSAQRNCTQNVYGANWQYPFDGCVSYADSNPPMPPTGANECPVTTDTNPATGLSPATITATPAFHLPTISAPSSNPTAQTLACDSTHPALPGGTYFWSSVTLGTGCTIDPRNGPVVIYTTGQVNIGDPNGNAGNVNPPPDTSGIYTPSWGTNFCPAGTVTAGLTDTANPTNPSSFYCPGWTAQLRIYMLSSATANVVMGNHVNFWGLIVSPGGTFSIGSSGGGSPHVTMWGALLVNSADQAAQLTMHYDDALGALTTGRYYARNWRECPIGTAPGC